LGEKKLTMVYLTLHTGRLVFLRNLFRSPLDTPTKKVKVWKQQLSHHHLGGDTGARLMELFLKKHGATARFPLKHQRFGVDLFLF